MADTTLYIRDAAGNLVPVDVRTVTDGSDRRQVVVLGDGENAGLLAPATEPTLAAIRDELATKLEPGQAVALDAATLAALETVQIGNQPINPATETTLAAVRTALGTPAADDVLALLRAVVTNTAGEVASVDTLNLTADQVQLNTDQVEAKLEAVRALLAGALTTTPTSAGDVASALTDGRKTVTTPGTAVALRATLACKWVQVVALKTNTQQVNVGGSGVLAAAGSSTGTPLDPGQSTTIPVNDAAKLFVDARVANEGVSFTVGA